MKGFSCTSLCFSKRVVISEAACTLWEVPSRVRESVAASECPQPRLTLRVDEELAVELFRTVRRVARKPQGCSYVRSIGGGRIPNTICCTFRRCHCSRECRRCVAIRWPRVPAMRRIRLACALSCSNRFLAEKPCRSFSAQSACTNEHTSRSDRLVEFRVGLFAACFLTAIKLGFDTSLGSRATRSRTSGLN